MMAAAWVLEDEGELVLEDIWSCAMMMAVM